MEFILDLENPFEALEPETERLFQMETEFMAAPDFFQNADTRRRRSAQRAMRRLSNTPGFEHDPLVPFLALNYYDRCISRHPIPDGWFFGLFVISCTILAWKMRTNGLPVQQLLGARPIRVGGQEIEVEVGHIERMEFLILSVLNWRTRSITPLCFINFFMTLINIDDPQERQTLKLRVFENEILDMHSDIRFTQFRPSTIALVGTVSERGGDWPDGFWDPIFGCEFLDPVEIGNCIHLLAIRAEEIAAAAVMPQVDHEPPQIPQIDEPQVVPQDDHEPPQIPQVDHEQPQIPQIDEPQVVPQVDHEPPQIPQIDEPQVDHEQPQIDEPQVDHEPPQIPQIDEPQVVPQVNHEPPQIPQIDEPPQVVPQIDVPPQPPTSTQQE